MTETQDVDTIGQFVEQHSGIVLGRDKSYLFESRLLPVMRAFGFAGLSELAEGLRPGQAARALQTAVLDAMTTNETSFFRDVHPYETLRDHLLPEILERNAKTRKLSIWSAASSTGQELYSIAMVLAEHFPQLDGWDVSLVGSDLSMPVVERAQQGVYTEAEARRGLPDDLRATYLEPVDGGYRVRRAVRERCSFFHRNLLEPWPRVPRHDIVFCRYVLIYFDVTVKAQILDEISRVTEPGGYLVLGGPETTVGVTTGWVGERRGRTPIYRNGTAR